MLYGKISKARNHIKIDAMVDIFPKNALGDGPAFWIFSGFMDKVEPAIWNRNSGAEMESAFEFYTDGNQKHLLFCIK